MARSKFPFYAANRQRSWGHYEVQLETILSCHYLLVYCSAHAELKSASGTIIVAEITNDEIVIAADSRGVLGDTIHDDKECKISAFKLHHTIFFATGTSRVIPNEGGAELFNAFDNAERALDGRFPVSGTRLLDYLDGVGNAWSQEGVSGWTQTFLKNPDHVRRIAQEGKGVLIQGIFAVGFEGQLDFVDKLLGLQNDQIQRKIALNPPECMNKPCSFGYSDTVLKYLGSGKSYMTASPKMLKKYGDPLLRVVRLVELSIAEDKSGFVGGPIDALSLHKDGTIHWYKRKPNCPENSD